MANGPSRLVLAKNVIDNGSQDDLNSKFENENDTAISVDKIPLKNPSEHNHSK